LTPTILARLHAKTLLVELASAPGGWEASLVDAERAIYAPGIPGKYAPKTAGDIVARTICSLLKEVKNL
jgi:dipicolinate synthase subunit A